MSRQERWWASQGAGARTKKAFLFRREKYAVRAPEAEEAVSPRAAAAAPPAADRARAAALRRQLLTAAESRAFAVRVVPLPFAELDAHFAGLDTSLFAA